MADRPNVILLYPGASSRTPIAVENIEHIETLPIDGMVMDIAQSFWLMDPPDTIPEGAEVTKANVDHWMSPELAQMNARMENNYLITYIDDPADLFNDQVWDGVIENFRVMAQAAKENNFKGLIFDNEEYNGAWDNFPEDHPGATADQLEEYQAQASLRGTQIMQAINEVFPDAELGVMHGPYTSVDGGDDTPASVLDQVGGPGFQELRGPFFTGLLEGLGPNQTLIDMGELYGARNEAEFAQSQDYRTNLVPDLIDWQVDPALLQNWDENVVISHMISTDLYPVDGPGITPDTLRKTVTAALNNSEEMIFVYSSSSGPGADGIVFDWLTPGAVPQEWVDAIANGIADFEANAPDAEPDQQSAPPVDDTPPAPPPAPDDDPAPDEDPSPPEPDDQAGPIRGTSGRDMLSGTNAEDVLIGGDGNDRLSGLGGADVLNGGRGGDEVDYGKASAAIVANLGRGEGYFNHADGDRYISIEHALGSRFDDMLVGNGAKNRLSGRDGDDELYGNGGNDWILGGGGADLIAGGTGRDTASYRDSLAGVRVNLALDTAAGGKAEGDRLIGIENLHGSHAADELTGDDGASILRGLGGNDILVGRWGQDRLQGDRGNDTMTGGGDADTFIFRMADGRARDVITDFSAGQGDTRRFGGLKGADDSEKFASLAITQQGDDVKIIAGKISVILEDTAAETIGLGQIDFF